MKITYLCMKVCYRWLIALCCFGLPEAGIYANDYSSETAVESVSHYAEHSVSGRSRIESDAPPAGWRNITITGGNFTGVNITPEGIFWPENGFQPPTSETAQLLGRPEDMFRLIDRIDSLNEANVVTHSALTLAQCGFFSPAKDASLQCFSCHVKLGAWKVSDHALGRHFSNKRQCAHVLVLCQNPPPINRAMQKCSARILACADLPASVFSGNKTPMSLGKAGLYALGSGDRAKCFYCDGGLENWEPHDDALDEHVRWYPNCPLVAQLKTPEEIQAVLSRHNDDFTPLYKQSIFAGPFFEDIYNLRTHSLKKRVESFRSLAGQLSREDIRLLSLAGFSFSESDWGKAHCQQCGFSRQIDELLSAGAAELHQLQNLTDSPCPFVSQTMLLTEDFAPPAPDRSSHGEDSLQQAYTILIRQGYSEAVVQEKISELAATEFALPVGQLVAVLQARLPGLGAQGVSYADIARAFFHRGFTEEQVNIAFSELLERQTPINFAAVEQALSAGHGDRDRENERGVDYYAEEMGRLEAAMGAAGAGLSRAINRSSGAHRGTFTTARNGTTLTVGGVTIMRNGEWLIPQPERFGAGFRGRRENAQPRNGNIIDSQHLTPVTGNDDPEKCCICFTYKADHVYVPCGHVKVCGLCAERGASANGCPTCRAPVEGIFRTYR